jgi:chromosome segregation ATPase
MRVLLTRQEGDLAFHGARVEECEQRLAQIGDYAGTLMRELGQLRETADALSGLCAERGLRLAEREAQVTSLETQNAEYHHQQEQVSNALRDAEARIQRHAEEAASAKRELAALHEALDERGERIRERQLEAETLRDELASREAGLAQLEATVSELTRERAAAEAAADAVERHLTEVGTEVATLHRVVASQQVALDLAREAAVDAANDAALWRRRAGSILFELAAGTDELVLPEAAFRRPSINTRMAEAADMDSPTGHVRLAAIGETYRLTASDDACPRSGECVELDGRHFLVAGVGSSPLPGDRRRCVVLLPLPR